MQVKKEMLIDFLKVSSMTGLAQITECILNFSKVGIEIHSTSASNNVLISAILKKENIKEYQEIGELGIDNILDIIHLVDAIDNENINIEKKDNLLIFKANKKVVKIMLKSAEYVQGKVAYPAKVEKDVDFIIEVNEIKALLESAKTVGANEFDIKIDGANLYFKAKKFHEVQECLPIDNKEGTARCTFNLFFYDAIYNINGDANITFKTDYPTEVHLLSKLYDVNILICPAIKGE